MFSLRRALAYFKDLEQVILRLDVASIMPPEIFLPLDLGHHGVNPSRVSDGLQSNILRSLYCRVSGIVALHCIATCAYAAGNLR